MQETRRKFLIVSLFLGLGEAIEPAAGQYTSNFQTNTISGVTNYWPDDYVVGSNTFADALMIRNGPCSPMRTAMRLPACQRQ